MGDNIQLFENQPIRAAWDSERFLITSKPHPIRKPGFPLDSLSVDMKTGKYYYDNLEEKLDVIAVEDGFWSFFERFFESKI